MYGLPYWGLMNEIIEILWADYLLAPSEYEIYPSFVNLNLCCAQAMAVVQYHAGRVIQ
jgi:hypothetical protein